MTFSCAKIKPSTIPNTLSTQKPLSVIQNQTRNFGNIIVHLHSLGSSAYRIEWVSRMTGTSTSISRLSADKYSIMKKWPSNKGLPCVSSDFENRKSALIHFINNVDILKATTEMIYDAKKFCLELFTKQEHIPPLTKPSFPKLRLQGAIGRPVEIKSKSSKEVIAEGTLLQLVGANAEVRIEKRFCLSKPKEIQGFSTNRVFIK